MSIWSGFGINPYLFGYNIIAQNAHHCGGDVEEAAVASRQQKFVDRHVVRYKVYANHQPTRLRNR